MTQNISTVRRKEKDERKRRKKKKEKRILHIYHSTYYHGTIIRTGITREKIPCYIRDSAYRCFIVENAKIFRSYVKHF